MIKKITINSLLTCAAALVIATPQIAKAAFIVEAVPTGRGYANFTGPANFSSVRSTALGLTGVNSVFGMAGNSTYTFAYTPGTDTDNFTPTIGADLGNGNLATGAAGGVSGNYNVYVTWPNSANVDNSGTHIQVFNDSTTVSWPAVNQNNVAPHNVDYPGVLKWWCVATNVPLTGGNTYTVVSTPNNPGGFVSQRFSGVMWERVPATVDPCTTVPLLSLTQAPYVVGTNVTVSGVSGSATNITIYQNTGSGMTAIGSKTNGVIAGTNVVTTTIPLAKGAILAATQTINGQESCVPTTGPFVGGGANPPVRIALSIRETAATGPVGAPASGSTFIHFLGASAMSANLTPTNAEIFFPTNEWQTVTIGGKATIGNSANVVGTTASGSMYNPNDSLAIQVFAFKTVNGTRIYSSEAAQSSPVTSGNPFSVNWTWDAVPDAEGYRVLRNLSGNFVENADVLTNSFQDNSSDAWGFDFETTPKTAPNSPSIQWNGQAAGVINTNGPQTAWGILESINFAIEDEDTGSFDIYIDNIQNGETVFQTFETVASGTQDYAFRAPSFSGTTGPLLLPRPNLTIVTNAVADTGNNSLNVRFQWAGTNASHWLRLTTSTPAGNAENPLVNLADPISFRILMLPVGESLPPVGPPGPISIARDGGNVILSWPGTATLQSATDVAGPYNPVNGATSPHTNAATGQTFYRLAQ